LQKIVIGEQEVLCNLVLFDLDGTLLDDKVRYAYMARARFEVISKMVGREAAVKWAALSGVDIRDFSVDRYGPLARAPRKEDIVVAACALFLTGHRWYRAREIAEKAYREADRLQETKYKPIFFKEVGGALRALKKAGLKLGIATNGSGAAARGIMASLGFEDLFDVIVGADMVEKGKPAPDIILLACESIGAEPSETVYVGDAQEDMVAGRAAGCRAVIAVNNVDDDETTSLADIVTYSVANFRVPSPPS